MASRSRVSVVRAFALVGLVACGGRSVISHGSPGNADVGGPAELCDGLDQDGDGRVDEDFRDDDGNYLVRAHCGSCGHACDTLPNAQDVGCMLLAGAPSCVATRCNKGFGLSRGGGCVALDDHLCLACRDDGDCGTLRDARCIAIGNESRCTRACGEGCADGYVCVGADHCEPEGNSCSCSKAHRDFTLACSAPSPDQAACVGSARCSDGVLSDCELPSELCDGADNDCDGLVDEGFVDAMSVYSVDLRNCGACGIDCSVDTDAGLELACGGDPFAPSCVNACPDTADGIQIGDRLDADRRLRNGCECRVVSLVDVSGAARGEPLDTDCDGADGHVLSSFYVSVGGDDNGPGSPTRPLRSINTAILRAVASLDSGTPRPDVFVASGVYTESVHMRDGISLHGGYRSDFLARSPSGFEVVVVAPADTTAFGGAALSAQSVGVRPTTIEGFTFRGRDAIAAGEPAIAVDLRDPRPHLTLRDLHLRSGAPGAGVPGAAGVAGAAPKGAAADGAPPRAALENASHVCIANDSNRVRGGAGGANVCNGIDASGGDGGSSTCPVWEASEGAGQDGRNGGSSGGHGGVGGLDLKGPIRNDPSCPSDVCCGLADFVVPGAEIVLPGAGRVGEDGTSGRAGLACSDPTGTWSALGWSPALATDGAAGKAGGGAGGGGAGGGAEMLFIEDACEFPDGLGGAGGGGGAAGCGGFGGSAGGSGGPAVGLLIRDASEVSLPVLSDLVIETRDGGAGGAGGAGGDGGEGGSGGFGGELRDVQRSTPPLAGPLAGERGGKGGDGGAGGGGGGGCGGSSIGIWIYGLGAQDALVARLSDANRFQLGEGQAGGPGGGGPKPAAAGAQGRALNVFAN